MLKFNAKNLLFYEDTVPTLKQTLASNNDIDINDYNFKIEHQESLHDTAPLCTIKKLHSNALMKSEHLTKRHCILSEEF
ncbi:MAG: hypothetical protein ACTJH9_13835 [Pseudoalteromonas sp.]